MKARVPTIFERLTGPRENDILIKPAAQLLAEAIWLRGLLFSEADPDELAACFRWRARTQGGYTRKRESRSAGRPISVIYLPGAGVPIPVTVTWKRRLTIWDAIRATGRLAGLEVSVRGDIILLHDPDARPTEISVLDDELWKFPHWKRCSPLRRAASNSMKRIPMKFAPF